MKTNEEPIRWTRGVASKTFAISLVAITYGRERGQLGLFPGEASDEVDSFPRPKGPYLLCLTTVACSPLERRFILPSSPALIDMGLREILIPQEKIFFQLLERESKNVLAGAQALNELILNYDDLANRRDRIKEIEHHGDEIVHEIYDHLVKSFVTPIDREDISKLASLYDDVLDYIYAVV